MMESTTLLPKKANINKLSANQLVSIKELLERYFWGVGVNVALHNALKRKESISFEKKVAEAIRKQILHVAKSNTIHLSKADDWLPFEDAIEGKRETIFFFLLFIAGLGGQAALNKMVPQHIFELKNIKLKKELGERVDFLLDTLDETTKGWINSIVSQAENNTEAVNFLREQARSQAKMRAETITETEAMYSMNLVEMETYRRNGIEKVLWKTAEDERTCEICLANEAAGELEIGKEFPMGTASPPAHIRCRCLLLPVLPVTIENIWTGQ